jgi:hypothetical protein
MFRRDFWEYLTIAVAFLAVVLVLSNHAAYGGELRSGSGAGVTVGGSITGGTDTRVLFNDGGALGEDSGFTFVKATDALTLVGFVASASFRSTAADPADAGVLRLANNESLCWESSPTGTDVCLQVNSGEQLLLSPAGTEAVPGLVYSGETGLDTGWFIADGEWFFTKNGQSVLRLDGDVKIDSEKGLEFYDGTDSDFGGNTHKIVVGATGFLSLNVAGSNGGGWHSPARTLTIADSGGAGAATHTLTTPIAEDYDVTCSDADGCDFTFGETSILNNQKLCLTNVSANALNFADTSGVSELAGAFAAGQYDTICAKYKTDRWVEFSRSNN